jgi:putative PEP-CTERM system TPR-repeat lipoprotein
VFYQKPSTWAVVLCAALVLSGCRTDPEKAKRTALAAADKHAQKAEYSDAVIEYKRALQFDPKFGEAHLKLGQLYRALRDAPNAYREFLRAADLMPDNVNAQLEAGNMMLFARDFDGARDRAMKVIAKDNKNIDGQLLLGNALAGLKDLDTAIQEVEGAIEQDPSRTYSYSNLGLLQAAKGNTEAAEAAFKRAVTANPNSAAAHLALANFYWASGRLPEAEQELKSGRAASPKSTKAALALATFYIGTQRADQAEPLLKFVADISPDVRPKLSLADYYMSAKRSEDALRVLEPLINSNDGFAPARLRIAVIKYDQGKIAEAHKDIDTILAREPNNEAVHLAKVRFLLAERKYADALSSVKAIVARNNRSASGYYLQGLALEVTNQPDEAIQSFQRTLELNPGATLARLELARLFLAKNDAKAAATYADEVLKAQPNSADAKVLLAKALAVQGQFKAAEASLTATTKSNPKVVDAQVALGAVYMSQRDFSRAREAFSRALEIDSNSFEAFRGTVRADLGEKKLNDARSKIDRRLGATPKDVPLLLLAGNTYFALNDPKQAEAAFRRALAVDPANPEIYNRLASLYVSQHRLDEARAEFERVVERSQKPVAELTLVGLILDVQKKPDEARKRYEQALAIDPGAPVAANNLAWMYADRKENLDQALQLAQAAKGRMPKAPQVDDTIGWVYYQKGLSSLAIESFKTCTAAEPNNASYLYHLGLAYAQKGDKFLARQTLERALKVNGEFEGAADARRVLQTLKG